MCTATGGRRFDGFGVKPSPYRENEMLRRLCQKFPKKNGAHGPASTWALQFDGLGLKTVTRLLWAGRSPDKIETLKVK